MDVKISGRTSMNGMYQKMQIYMMRLADVQQNLNGIDNKLLLYKSILFFNYEDNHELYK